MFSSSCCQFFSPSLTFFAPFLPSLPPLFCSQLYVDLVRGIREQRTRERKRTTPEGAKEIAAAHEVLKEYEVMMNFPPTIPLSSRSPIPNSLPLVVARQVMMKAVLADGLAHPLEKAMLRDFARQHNVTEAYHNDMLRRLGWSLKEWERGVKAGLEQDRQATAAAAGWRAAATAAGASGANAGGKS